MAKKSYDQRLKERWSRRERDGDIRAKEGIRQFDKMMRGLHSAGKIIASIFRPGRP